MCMSSWSTEEHRLSGHQLCGALIIELTVLLD